MMIKNDRPLVSIITAVRNGEKTIGKTISSVLNQTYSNIEYIIIDGGSTDATLGIIKKNESQLAYWKSEPDRGIADAWNKGIAASHGELVGIINSDDWYNPDTVEIIVKAYLSDKTVDVIHGDILFYFNDGSCELVPACPDPRSLLTGMTYNHPTCFVKKSVYEGLGVFDTHYTISTDYELLLRFFINGVRFRYINKVLAYMRVGGVSDRASFASLREVRDISIRYGYHAVKANIWFFMKVVGDKAFFNRKILHKTRRWMRKIIGTY